MNNLDSEDIKELDDSLELVCITNLLSEIIKKSNRDLIYDPDFIILDKSLDFNANNKIFNDLLIGYQRKFTSDGVISNIEYIQKG